MLVIALMIRHDSKGPALFKQKRLGKNKKIFTVYKFRTMKTDAPKNCPTHELENPDRYITSLGIHLRNWSLDELPQLFNVFLGQMSVIGPRPINPNLTEWINERDKYGANDLRPGLTGWAQINGRDNLAICEKAFLDGVYANNISFWFDVKCFFKTIVVVLKRADITEGCVKKKKEQNKLKFSPTERTKPISVDKSYL